MRDDAYPVALRPARGGSRRRVGAAFLVGLLVLGGAAACAGSGTATSQPTDSPSATATSADGRPLPLGAAAQVVTDARWTLGFDSDFDGTRLDTKVWRVGEPWQQAPGFEEGPEAYCPLPQGSQVTVSGGELHLVATRDPDDKDGRLLSCGVSTRDSFSMTHGYVETRVKLPTGAGLWPSFWLLGNGVGAAGWPKTGEIDAFEFVNNGTANGVPFLTVHWAGDCPDEHCSFAQLDPPIARIRDYGTRWVTYGLLRTADRLTVYVNGVEAATVSPGERNPQGIAIGDVIFNNPMHIKLDLSAGGWATDPRTRTQPGEFTIDYVRAWT